MDNKSTFLSTFRPNELIKHAVTYFHLKFPEGAMTNSKSLLLFLSIVTFTLFAGPTMGQTSEEAAAENVMEEITVTSRKRAERLEDVPATVDAFSAQKIEEAGIESMRDYIGLSSNITLVETQNSGFAFVNIRGLSQIRNSDPTVALVIDGVLSTTGLGFSQDLYDIQQVEILKGPQGALYGRNASGGAINITTKQPSNEFEGFIRAGYGNGDNKSVTGSISGALIRDVLLGRVSASYRKTDGWRDSFTLPQEVDPYEDTSIRGKLIWFPTQNLSVDFRASYSETETAQSQYFVNAPNFILPPPEGGLPGIAHGFAGRENGTSYRIPGIPPSLAAIIGDPNNTSVQTQGNLPGNDLREASVFSAKIDWETDIGTVTSVTAFDDLDSIAWGQEGFPYFPFLMSFDDPDAGTRSDAIVLPPSLFQALAAINSSIGQNRFHESISQELRLTSASDQRLRWIVGGYYVQTDLDVMISVNRDLGQGSVRQVTDPNIGGINPTATWNERFIATVAPVFGGIFPGNPGLIPPPCLVPPLSNLPPAVCAAILANPNQNPNALSYNYDTNDNTAYAFFGQMNYDLSETIELSFALRYDRDERELTVAADDQYLPVFDFPSAREGDVRKANYDSWQPKATIRWQPNDDLTLYGVYAQGFRSGGFNLSGVSAGIEALSDAGVPGLPNGVEDSWDQEDTKGIEFGLKTNFLNGRVRLNAAVFYTDIDNAFTFSFVAPFNAQVIRNIDEAEVLGLEASATWMLTDNLSFDFGFGLLDSEIKKSSWLGAGGINIEGKELPLNPESTVNAAISYNRTLFGSWDGFIRLDYQRLGKTPFEPENFVKRDPVDLVNLRLGLSSANGWQFTGWVRNLTDEDYTQEFTNPNGISWPSRLRSYGIEVTKRFGAN
jgi:iron complex outermembrane receptor protein